MSQRIIFYLTRSDVYHIVPGDERNYTNFTLCGWYYRGCKVSNTYYDAKLGIDWHRDGAVAYHRTLCKRCQKVLEAGRNGGNTWARKSQATMGRR